MHGGRPKPQDQILLPPDVALVLFGTARPNEFLLELMSDVRLPGIDLEVNLGISGCCRSLVERRWGRSRKGANRSGVELKKDH